MSLGTPQPLSARPNCELDTRSTLPTRTLVQASGAHSESLMTKSLGFETLSPEPPRTIDRVTPPNGGRGGDDTGTKSPAWGHALFPRGSDSGRETLPLEEVGGVEMAAVSAQRQEQDHMHGRRQFMQPQRPSSTTPPATYDGRVAVAKKSSRPGILTPTSTLGRSQGMIV